MRRENRNENERKDWKTTKEQGQSFQKEVYNKVD